MMDLRTCCCGVCSCSAGKCGRVWKKKTTVCVCDGLEIMILIGPAKIKINGRIYHTPCGPCRKRVSDCRACSRSRGLAAAWRHDMMGYVASLPSATLPCVLAWYHL